MDKATNNTLYASPLPNRPSIPTSKNILINMNQIAFASPN